MRHTILIMAHKDFDHLIKLIEYFTFNCDVFIHWDKKKPLNKKELTELYKHTQVKKILQDYEVHWGGTSVLECELHLIRTAIHSVENDYIHLISGQDYPTRPLSFFLRFFEENNGKDFIQYTHLPHPNWEDNTFRRFQYYYPYDYAGNQENAKQWVGEQVRSQYKKGIKRPIPDEFEHLYGCSQWFSISQKSANVLIDYTDEHPEFYNRLWMTFAPEECYPATVLVNILGKENIVCDNLRFIRWKYENGNRPANLGMQHFCHLLKKDYLFARKMEKPYCNDLKEIIDKYLTKEELSFEISETGAWLYNGVLQYSFDKSFCDFVALISREMGARSAIDVGCGCGYYVSQWLSQGIPFVGCDANPYTDELSKLLLPNNNTPCKIVDITNERLEFHEQFDLVVCKDVVPYITTSKLDTVVSNLARLSYTAILISWNVSKELEDVKHNKIEECDLIEKFNRNGYVIDKSITARLHVALNMGNCCFLIREGAQLINY